MKIIKDTFNNEFGILREVKMAETIEDLAKKMNMKRNKKIKLPPNIGRIKIPVLEFYDKEDNFYDKAFYTSEIAFKRYEVIKEISEISEFFNFRKTH